MNIHSTTAVMAPPNVDPMVFADDPHAAFASLRADYPVIRLGERQYMALRSQDVIAMLTDPRTKQIEGPDYVALARIPKGVARDFLSDFFLFSNGDVHRARRGLFARTFAHANMRAARSRVRAVADAIVARLPRGESFDFVDRMAARVPAEMIAEILGLPGFESRYFATRVYDLARAVSPVYPHEHHAAIESAATELFTYVQRHMRERLDEPRGDMLSELVADWKENPAISFDCLVNQVLGLIVGGSDTTRAGFAMLVALLLQHRDQWDALRDVPSLIPGAVAEGLRYEPPVGTIARMTTAEVDTGGAVLPAGVMLRVSTMSALRDPAQYEDPDRFDITRTDHPRLHTVFGLGPHRCLGEMLARIEMEEGLAALLAAAPDIELELAPRMIGWGGIRQITPMQVRIH